MFTFWSAIKVSNFEPNFWNIVELLHVRLLHSPITFLPPGGHKTGFFRPSVERFADSSRWFSVVCLWMFFFTVFSFLITSYTPFFTRLFECFGHGSACHFWSSRVKRKLNDSACSWCRVARNNALSACPRYGKLHIIHSVILECADLFYFLSGESCSASCAKETKVCQYVYIS